MSDSLSVKIQRKAHENFCAERPKRAREIEQPILVGIAQRRAKLFSNEGIKPKLDQRGKQHDAGAVAVSEYLSLQLLPFGGCRLPLGESLEFLHIGWL